jgi:hypothetical protein
MNERKGPSLDQYPVLSEFQDALPNELPGLPPKRELDFTIELKTWCRTNLQNSVSDDSTRTL